MITTPNTIDPHDAFWQQPTREPSTRFITIDEVADFLHVSKWMVYNQIQQKRLKTITIGSRRLVAPEDLQAYIDQLRSEAGGFHG